MKDDLGDRMKAYEAVEAKRLLDSSQPVIARIDGRTFSKFTKGFQKPFDPMLTHAMDQTVEALVDKTHAAIGYTQSDEITLIWPEQGEGSQMFFGGRVQKLCSVLAGMASVNFVYAMMEYGQLNRQSRLREVSKTQVYKPHFDCRVWSVPDRDEATNTLWWRVLDARKNAVSSFARQYVSHKKLQGLNQKQMLDAAYDNCAPDITSVTEERDRLGRLFQRVTRTRRLTDDEWYAIPTASRPPRDIEFTRSKVEEIPVGPFAEGSHEVRKRMVFG